MSSLKGAWVSLFRYEEADTEGAWMSFFCGEQGFYFCLSITDAPPARTGPGRANRQENED